MMARAQSVSSLQQGLGLSCCAAMLHPVSHRLHVRALDDPFPILTQRKVDSIVANRHQTLTGCRSGSATCCCDCTKSISLLRALTYARALPTTTSSCAAEAAKLRCAVLPCKMVEEAVNSSCRHLVRFLVLRQCELTTRGLLRHSTPGLSSPHSLPCLQRVGR